MPKNTRKGNKIKATIKFKGRQLAHTELGEEVLMRFAKELESVSEIEQNQSLNLEPRQYC